MAESEHLEEASRFVDYLLSRPVAPKVAKVFVFGSVVKGGATADSDVDILIVTLNGDAVGEQIDDALLDFHLQSAAPLEVVTCALSEILPPTDYFLVNVLRYGKEIYSMPQEEIKRTAARDLAALAREYLEASEEALERERHRLAADGAYNAAELAAKGLILLKVDDLPGSHGGIVQLFGSLYVQSGELEREIGRQLNTALRLRNLARYRYDAIVSKQDAETVLSLARQLLSRLETQLGP
jgi:uncharacterized protein (UPF0332 family)/predicted nucleotidyltransferase